jgi:3-phenylpropionate/trans-cinnamate dioxygenase ferredoxin reductase subunit
MSTQPHIAIVGAGHAGGRVAQHLRTLGCDTRITLIGDEPYAPYERPALSKELLRGEKTPGDLALGPASFWSEPGEVDRVYGYVRRLDPAARTLTLDDGAILGFEQLVIATGGTPRRLPVPGMSLDGVVCLRTIDDCLAMRARLGDARHIAIIGAGVIGMEAAASAASLGIGVTVLEAGARVLARCVPALVSEWLAGVHRVNGVHIETNIGVHAIERRTGAQALTVCAAHADGARFEVEVDLVLVAIGIDCTPAFVKDAGIPFDDGLLVGSDCRSEAAPWCYAAGDVARTWSPLYGRHVRQETWRNAENQARAVAEFIAGRDFPYVEVPWMWTDQFGHHVQVVGLPGADDELFVRGSLDGGPVTIVFTRGGRVAGGVLIDHGRERRYLEALVTRAAVVAPQRLADPAISLKELAQ